MRKAAESGCSLAGEGSFGRENRQTSNVCLSVRVGKKQDYWDGLDREVRAEGPNGALAKDYFNSEARTLRKGTSRAEKRGV